MRVLLLAAVVAVLPACSDPDCDPTQTSCTYERAVSTMTVGAGVEDENTCQSWTLNNPTELWINAITQHNDGAYHHANWFFVPDDQFKLPDGTWTCSDNNFDELVAALEGGYLFALSTQSHEETQQLPEHSAIRIPPYSRIIGASHLLNANDTPVTTTMSLSITSIPLSTVTAKLAPARITYHDLHIDAATKSSFMAECDIASGYAQWNNGAPLQYQLMYTLTHYHQLGVYQQIEVLGGPHDGEVIMRHDGFGNNAGTPIQPAFDLGATEGARGIRFRCGFDNPRSVPVGWGIGDQEMCVMALQAVTNIGFDATVNDGADQSLGVAQDGEMQHAGACTVTTFPWDFEKPGGQGH